MLAIVVGDDPARSLRWQEVAEPAPPPADHVLVEVAATAVNRADLLQRAGRYPPPPGAPATLGLELAGRIARLGAGAAGWSAGDRVCAIVAGGGYAERCLVPAGSLMRVPDRLSLTEAAAVPEAFLTAFVNLFQEAELRAGESVLIHGGASGVGTAAIQLARCAGARVAVTARDDRKLAACRRLGAELAIDHTRQDFAAAIEAAWGGVDVVLDYRRSRLPGAQPAGARRPRPAGPARDAGRLGRDGRSGRADAQEAAADRLGAAQPLRRREGGDHRGIRAALPAAVRRRSAAAGHRPHHADPAGRRRARAGRALSERGQGRPVRGVALGGVESPSAMAQVTASGAALFRWIDGALHFLAVESRLHRGYWGLVKGRLEAGETVPQAARREIAEEVGLRGVSFLPGFREEVRYRLPSGDDKLVIYFLAAAGAGEVRLQAEELADYRWLPFPEVCELFTFPEAGRVVERAVRFLEAGRGGPPAGRESIAGHALRRPHAAALDEILGRRLDVLDDGFVRVVDYLGNDAAIVQAARVSYGEGTRRVSDDRGLIRYLMRHRHTTPFEMCELKLHVRAPMDAWRQWIRHRTASVNEVSTRYSIAIDAAQATPPAEWRTQAAGNRQGSGGLVDRSVGERLSAAEADLQRQARQVYQERLDAGVAREQARKDLPLSTYTEAYWKIDLHNLLHFLALRMDDHAQLEIRRYARVIGTEVVARWCPLAWEAFCDYRLRATSLSRIETELVAALAAGDAEAGMSIARAAGWLAQRTAEPGRLARNRERAEAEARLLALGLPAPWGDGSGGKGRPAAGVD